MKKATATMKKRVGTAICNGSVLDEMLETGVIGLAEGCVAFVWLPAVEPEPAELEFWELVAAVAGAEEFIARLAKITLKALSCCPNPVFQSSLPVHPKPHAVLLSPPEQAAAAPFAEACR